MPEQESRVWWRTTGTYHILTYPQFRLTPGIPVWLPDPAPCSGFVIDYSQPKQVRYVKPCTCCECWITEYNRTPLISDPKFVNNGEINNLTIGFIETNRRTMYD